MESSGWCTLSLMPNGGESAAQGLDQHRSAIERYIRKMVRDGVDAEDLTQETFIRAVRQRDNLRDEGALLSWLYQIATRVCLDHLRRKTRMEGRRHEQRVEDVQIEDLQAVSPLTIVQRHEMSECVQRYVAQLTDDYRAVLLLHDVDGASAAEISDLLALPLSTVKMRIHRARRNLQAMLNEACGLSQDLRGVLVCEPKREC